MPKVKINDINMYYETRENGYPLVLIMGLSGNLDWWDPSFIEEISSLFKVILFDNRGAGRSDKPDIEYSIKMFADDTAGLMNALKVEKAHILGASMGGMISQEFALNYPERVDKLVLCCTHCGGSKQILPTQDVLKLLNMNVSGMSREEVMDKILIPLLFTEDFTRNNPSKVEEMRRAILKAPIPNFSYKRQLDAINHFNAGKRLAAIKCPTLIMQGEKDILVLPKNAEVLAKFISHAKVKFFENCAHIFFSEFPELVVKTLLEFL